MMKDEVCDFISCPLKRILFGLKYGSSVHFFVDFAQHIPLFCWLFGHPVFCFPNRFKHLLEIPGFQKWSRKQEANTHTLWEEVVRTVWTVEYSGGLQGRPSSSETPPSSLFLAEITAGGEPSRIACFSCICTANIDIKILEGKKHQCIKMTSMYQLCR